MIANRITAITAHNHFFEPFFSSSCSGSAIPSGKFCSSDVCFVPQNGQNSVSRSSNSQQLTHLLNFDKSFPQLVQNWASCSISALQYLHFMSLNFLIKHLFYQTCYTSTEQLQLQQCLISLANSWPQFLHLIFKSLYLAITAF
jgi:hypothetical protein